MELKKLEDAIKLIIIQHLNLEANYFSRFSADGNNLLFYKDLAYDMLDRFEILEKIEEKLNIIITDENLIWDNNITLGNYIKLIYNIYEHKM